MPLNPHALDERQSNPAPGIAASTVHLPPGAWPTVFECLCEHFAAIPREVWRQRFEKQRVLDAQDKPLSIDEAYREGLCVRYFREVVSEPFIPFVEDILYADGDLVVADKPHFLPVTPSGGYVEQTLLHRLTVRLANRDLVPLHRIDRATAGLVLFSANPQTRSRYQALFRDRQIEKTYLARAGLLPTLRFPLVRKTRLVAGEPFFRMQESEGEPNSETWIDLAERDSHSCSYVLKPVTGKKHQLRVHMAALGAAIENDPFYPQLQTQTTDDFSRPLKLLAKSLQFIDPISGKPRHFESRLTL
jgi:tRNA pseudouridine32 synthase/23S rRNA pseudouridine746 synthase